MPPIVWQLVVPGMHTVTLVKTMLSALSVGPRLTLTGRTFEPVVWMTWVGTVAAGVDDELLLQPRPRTAPSNANTRTRCIVIPPIGWSGRRNLAVAAEDHR